MRISNPKYARVMWLFKKRDAEKLEVARMGFRRCLPSIRRSDHKRNANIRKYLICRLQKIAPAHVHDEEENITTGTGIQATGVRRSQLPEENM
jgi:hypothetical protein